MKKFEFPVLKKYEYMIDEILRKKKAVILYGFNDAGRKTYEELKSKATIECILDVLVCQTESEIDGIPILSPYEYQEYRNDVVFIICSNRYYEEMKGFLEDKGVNRIVPYYAIYSGRKYKYKEYLSKYILADRVRGDQYIEETKQKIHDSICVIDTIDYVITEKCSLKCKECSNLMQYFQHPENANLEDSIRIMDKLLNNVDFIYEIRILGGEPFVNKEWYRYIEPILMHDNIGSIIIYTNGTIMPNEEALAVLKDARVSVSISDYGSLSKSADSLTSYLEGTEFFFKIGKVTDWVKCGKIGFHKRTEDELKQMYHTCCMSGCLSLKDGKIFGCPFAGSVFALKAIPVEESEYIDIDLLETRNEIRNKIMELQQRSYIKECRYCEGRPIGKTNIPAAEQVDRALPYKKRIES